MNSSNAFILVNLLSVLASCNDAAAVAAHLRNIIAQSYTICPAEIAPSVINACEDAGITAQYGQHNRETVVLYINN